MEACLKVHMSVTPTCHAITIGRLLSGLARDVVDQDLLVPGPRDVSLDWEAGGQGADCCKVTLLGLCMPFYTSMFQHHAPKAEDSPRTWRA